MFRFHILLTVFFLPVYLFSKINYRFQHFTVEDGLLSNPRCQTFQDTTGAQNTAIGYSSLDLHTTGFQNTAGVFKSLYSNNTHWNIAVGYQALYNTNSGVSNTAIGYQAGLANTSGAVNLFLGFEAGTTGNDRRT